jgi:sugar lactone lactonase YvrE
MRTPKMRVRPLYTFSEHTMRPQPPCARRRPTGAALILALLAATACDDSTRETSAGTTADATRDAAPAPAMDAAPPTPDLAPLAPDATPPAPDAHADALAAEPDAAPAPPSLPLDQPVPATCRGDLAPGEKVVFHEGFPAGSEGIAAGPDALYVSSPRSDTVWRLAPDGTRTVFAEVPHALGLAFLSDGRLAVADIGASNSVGVADGGVVLVAPDGTVTRIATDMESPNFVTVLPDDSLLVSDDFVTHIWHVTLDGQVTAVVDDVPSPNGMAFNLARDRLLVVSTFSPGGEITSFPVDAAGLPIAGEAQVLLENGVGLTQDGVALDAHDHLYVARNVAGQIVRHRADGSGEPVVVAEGLRTPASIAFGRAPDFDPCSIYVTELFGNRVWRIAVGDEGASLP